MNEHRISKDGYEKVSLKKENKVFVFWEDNNIDIFDNVDIKDNINKNMFVISIIIKIDFLDVDNNKVLNIENNEEKNVMDNVWIPEGELVSIVVILEKVG